jgi:hypothetical protein
MQPETMFKNLSPPLMLEIDAIDNLGITNLSITQSLMLQEDLNLENFQKADLSHQYSKNTISPGNLSKVGNKK